MKEIIIEPGSKIEYKRDTEGHLKVTVMPKATFVFEERVQDPGDFTLEVILQNDSSLRIYSVAHLKNQDTSKVVHKVLHSGSGSTSEIYTKGVISEKGRLNYDSDISAEKNIFKVSGNQKAEFILESKEASVFAIPNLNIFTQDVSVRHAVSARPVDGKILQYMGLRGLSEEDAQREYIDSFLSHKYAN